MTEEKLYFLGDEYFIGLIRDIHGARHRVDLETYIFELDPVGRAVIAALTHAVARGVRVRLLVDGVGLPLADAELLETLEGEGIPFRIFHPIPWFFRHRRYTAGGLDLWALWSRLNHRNHRKVCCIDRRIVWIGSFNISACHLPREQGGEGWRDTAVRIEDVDTDVPDHAFERAWNPWFRRPRPRNRVRSPFRLNDTRRQRRRLHRGLIRRIVRGRDRIWITNAYFVPERRAQRGVDVRILLPSVSDVFFMPWTAAVFYGSLLEHGVRIYEYLPAVLHAKTLIIDEWMTVGSSNLNSRSLSHDLEADYVLDSPAAKAALVTHFLQDINDSRPVSQEAYAARPRWQSGLAHLLLLARDWF